jgi:hypothetical protein
VQEELAQQREREPDRADAANWQQHRKHCQLPRQSVSRLPEE